MASSPLLRRRDRSVPRCAFIMLIMYFVILILTLVLLLFRTDVFTRSRQVVSAYPSGNGNNLRSRPTILENTPVSNGQSRESDLIRATWARTSARETKPEFTSLHGQTQRDVRPRFTSTQRQAEKPKFASFQRIDTKLQRLLMGLPGDESNGPFENTPENRVANIVARFSGPRPVVTVRGFFSSGTNWLRQLLLKNCPELLFLDPVYNASAFTRIIPADADGIYGWKHGLIRARELNAFKAHESHSMAIVSREALTWIVSAWKMNAFLSPSLKPLLAPGPKLKNATMDKFMQYAMRTPVNETGVPFGNAFIRDYYLVNASGNAEYALISPDMFGVRTQLYRNWLELTRDPSISSRVKFLRYEDLLANPFEEFSALMRDLRLPCQTHLDRSNFEAVEARVKMGTVDKTGITPQQEHPRREACYIIKTQELYEQLLARLDRTFEKEILGYEYPPTLEEYCKDVPELVYPTSSPTIRPDVPKGAQPNSRIYFAWGKQRSF